MLEKPEIPIAAVRPHPTALHFLLFLYLGGTTKDVSKATGGGPWDLAHGGEWRRAWKDTPHGSISPCAFKFARRARSKRSPLFDACSKRSPGLGQIYKKAGPSSLPAAPWQAHLLIRVAGVEGSKPAVFQSVKEYTEPVIFPSRSAWIESLRKRLNRSPYTVRARSSYQAARLA